MWPSLQPSGLFLTGCLSLTCLSPFILSQSTNIPQEIIINSGRPTFFDPSTSVPGKIALEEHVGNSLFSGTFTTPFVNFTNEVNFDLPIYQEDIVSRLTDINSRVAAMDAANISMSVLLFGAPGIQGIFNTTFATMAATFVNNELSRIYTHGNFSSRFGFWCSNALQDPVSAAAELERCVKELGGVGSFVGGYTNNGSANDVIYLDDPINAPFLKKVVELDVPIYFHAREPPPNQQRVYQDFNFLAGSPWGFSSETSAHVLRLMVAGIFDTYPTLKIILGHCGEGLPFVLPRIDQRIRHFTHYWPAKQTMTYYWENNFYVTTSGVQDAGALMDTLKRVGEDRVMFSVDYPFEDEVEIGGWFDRLELNGNTKKKIGYQNARNLLKLGN
jgi:predicted TIM-barrel fold metal-dependent hydrolase